MAKKQKACVTKVFNQQQVDFINRQLSFILEVGQDGYYSGLFSELVNDDRFEDFTLVASEDGSEFEVLMDGRDGGYDYYDTIPATTEAVYKILEDIYLNGSEKYYP